LEVTGADTAARKSNVNTGIMAGAIAVAMLGLGFAAVPLYNLFCQVTGFGGTTMRVGEAQAAMIKPTDQQISIRFDANHTPELPWMFQPERTTQNVFIGQKSLAIYLAKNESDKPVTGMAAFNVVPELAGKYFNKVECFCFTEQTLKPGEEVRMPVTFYVDPKIMEDPNTKNIEEITLSYSFSSVDQKPKGS
jgi:cytochrome c oxidase assembly protein subunit 11